MTGLLKVKLQYKVKMKTTATSVYKRLQSCGACGFVAAIGVGFVCWSATQLYVIFCAPRGLIGFLQSLIVMDSTFCQLLMGLVTHTQTMYSLMLVGLLFAFIGIINKVIGWITDSEVQPVPEEIKTRILRSRHIVLP